MAKLRLSPAPCAFISASWLALFFSLTAAASVPATFIFGDSLVDTGNNNYINSLAKANIKYNGIDFGNGTPTGRFCNGRTVLDILGELVGLPPPPVYLDPAARGTRLLQGVNYASGAGGILQVSGYNFVGRIDFDEQLLYFQNTLKELVSTIGQQQTSDLISQSLFLIVFGSNDYINNYLLQRSPYHSYTPQQFQDVVISAFVGQLKTLYNLGARKFVLTNVGPLGCIPSQIAKSKNPNATCVVYINDLIINFNAAALVAANQLQAQLPGSRFTTSNAYGVFSKILNNPAGYGFKYSNEGCCGNGNLRGQFPCTPIAQICNDRLDYVFWDAFHPSDKVNVVLANAFYSGTQDDITPINVQQLVATS